MKKSRTKPRAGQASAPPLTIQMPLPIVGTFD
jgi:hypothetical protein